MSNQATLTKKDFQSDQEVRWCPGCGDYVILSAIQKYMADVGADPSQVVFVSGIGCSSRFPYYMNTYGFHTIHGRAPAFATGIKAANPELDVWLVTGDGDAMSIGGNHFIHLLRRNVNMNVLMFNNQIYGLTKGQYSPTSPEGTRTKTSPMGAIDRPFNPISLALGANGTFVARTLDTDSKHMAAVFSAAHKHQGTAFVEILQNCVIFNKDFYNDTVAKDVRAEKTIDLIPGEKMIFGAESEKGLRMNGWDVEVCSAEEADKWDAGTESSAPAFLMSQMDDDPKLPMPLGIFRSVEATCYDKAVNQQIKEAVATEGPGDLKELIWSGNCWEID